MSPLNAAIYPSPGRRRSPEAATGCPAFKKDSVWRRPDNDPSTSETVCPGQYTLADRFVSCVTWWDPNALDLEVEPAPGIRREALIMKDVPESVLVEGRQEYEKWRTRLETTIASGSRPSVSVLTATEWASTASSHESVSLIGREPTASRRTASRARRALAAADSVDQPGLFDEPRPEAAETAPPATAIEIVDAHRGDRPGGARFGELVHAVLASTALDADRAASRRWPRSRPAFFRRRPTRWALRRIS